MGNKRNRSRKYDRTRDDAEHYAKNKEAKRRKLQDQNITNVEEILDDDVNRDLDHNVDDMNAQNQIREQEIDQGMFKYCFVFLNPIIVFVNVYNVEYDLRNTYTDLLHNVDQDVEDIDETENDDVEDIDANTRSSIGMYIYISIGSCHWNPI